MKQHIVYISVGSNIGDKIRNCRAGIENLCHSNSTSLLQLSRLYRTSPVDYEDQDWFVNAVAKIETPLDPAALLKRIQQVQSDAGRKTQTIRFGPRILDLDIIFFDDMIFHADGLEIPHPRMHKRRFVLQPMCDIDPFIVHPVLQKSVLELLRGLVDGEQKIEEIQ